MGRKVLWIVGLAFVLSLVAFLGLQRFSSQSRKYVFINETSDHRFDESVRVSIMAATKRTGVQNAVVITDNFAAEDLEKTAAQLFSSLNIGEQQKGRGILYLFSPANKLLKIEVGYALEGVLPDATVNGLELAAKTFVYSDRYHDFWAELINTLNIELQKRDKGSVTADDKFDFSKFRFLSGGAGIASRLYSRSLDQLLTEFRHLSSTKQYLASSTPNESISIYLQSLKDGIGDSQLPILTTESRIFREVTPLTTFQLFRNWQMYTQAGIDRIIQDGDFAIAFFRPKFPVLPIVLKREEQKWRVHEPLSWSLFHRFEDSMRVFLKFPLEVKSQELAKYLKRHLDQPLYPMQSPIALDSLRNNKIQESDPLSIYFQLFWLPKVAKAMPVENLNQLDLDKLWIATDTYLNLGRVSDFLSAYRAAAAKIPNNKAIQANVEFYEDVLRLKDHEWLTQRPSP